MKLFYIYIASLALSCAIQLPINAQEILNGSASVDNVKIAKVADHMNVSMDITPIGTWNVKSDQAIVLTPKIENDGNSISLPEMRILGKNQYLRHLREASEENAKNLVYRASRTPSVHYETSIPYESWMDNCALVLGEDLCGCCQTLIATNSCALDQYSEPTFTPVFAYAVPQAEAVKVRSEAGQAYITFHVSRTEIDETYLDNRSELQKILNTIALVHDDKDVTITGMELKGYASPDGKYEENERLAKGRTEAVSAYIKRMSKGADYKIATSFEAENWEGLKDYLRQSDIAEREAILEIIDSPTFADAPDAREWKIKSSYPEAYRRLLSECYPRLRRTDYKVEYVVRSFSLEEAKELIVKRPQKLSLQEMYNVAQTYEPGSDEFNEVFDTAVRMFPDDAAANLNAANSALQRGDTVLAEKYLAKSGDSGEAIVARGILAMLKGDTKAAAEFMTQAEAMGTDAAEANLKQIKNFIK